MNNIELEIELKDLTRRVDQRIEGVVKWAGGLSDQQKARIFSLETTVTILQAQLAAVESAKLKTTTEGSRVRSLETIEREVVENTPIVIRYLKEQSDDFSLNDWKPHVDAGVRKHAELSLDNTSYLNNAAFRAALSAGHKKSPTYMGTFAEEVAGKKEPSQLVEKMVAQIKAIANDPDTCKTKILRVGQDKIYKLTVDTFQAYLPSPQVALATA